jgi:hypothetical protein
LYWPKQLTPDVDQYVCNYISWPYFCKAQSVPFPDVDKSSEVCSFAIYMKQNKKKYLYPAMNTEFKDGKDMNWKIFLSPFLSKKKKVCPTSFRVVGTCHITCCWLGNVLLCKGSQR